MSSQGFSTQIKERDPKDTDSELAKLHQKASISLKPILQHIAHPSPLIQDLCGYAETVEQRIALVALVPPFSNQKANQLLSHLPAEAIRVGYRGVVSRLRSETSYLAELADVGVAEIISGNLESPVNGALVRFFTEVGCPATYAISSRKARGAYDHDRKLVLIRRNPPNETLRWRSLIVYGALPPEIGTIDHELTHHAQRTGGSWDGVLTEVHSCIAQSDSPSYFEPRLDERHEVIHHIHRLYGVSPECRARITWAYDHIKALKLFGLNDREVGDLVGRDSYDESRKTYPLLRTRLLRAIDELQLDKKVLPPTIEALKARQTIELAVNRAKAREIAYKELLDLAAKNAQA